MRKKKESIITHYMDNCIICGKPTENIHHAISGTSGRKLSEEDGLFIPLCAEHHTGDPKYSVHGNYVISRWSKIVGQLAYEEEMLESGQAATIDEAREMFRLRYGESYL